MFEILFENDKYKIRKERERERERERNSRIKYKIENKKKWFKADIQKKINWKIYIFSGRICLLCFSMYRKVLIFFLSLFVPFLVSSLSFLLLILSFYKLHYFSSVDVEIFIFASGCLQHFCIRIHFFMFFFFHETTQHKKSQNKIFLSFSFLRSIYDL